MSSLFVRIYLFLNSFVKSACDRHFQSRCIPNKSDDEYSTSDLINLCDHAAVQNTEGFIEASNDGLVRAIDALETCAGQSAQSGLIAGSDVDEIKEELKPEAKHRVLGTADQLGLYYLFTSTVLLQIRLN